MQAWVLLTFASISLIIAAVIEYLAQKSQSAGGLALSATINDIPSLVTFGYLFVPTIIARLILGSGDMNSKKR